jgi:hypothetical protein
MTPAHICAGTGLTRPTSAPGLGSPRCACAPLRRLVRVKNYRVANCATPRVATVPRCSYVDLFRCSQSEMMLAIHGAGMAIGGGARPLPHPRRGSPLPTFAQGLGLTPATAAPGQGLTPAHCRGTHANERSCAALGPDRLRHGRRFRVGVVRGGRQRQDRPARDSTWAHPVHICTGTGLTPSASAPRPGSPPATSASGPHLRRDWAHPATSAPGLGSPLPTSAPGLATGSSRCFMRVTCAALRCSARFRRHGCACVCVGGCLGVCACALH